MLLAADTGPATLGGHLAAVDRYLAVDQDDVEALGPGVGLGEGGLVGDAGGVEDDDVGGHPGLEESAIPELERAGWQRGHPADGVFEGEDLLLAHVDAEDARIGPVGAGVRAADAH